MSQPAVHAVDRFRSSHQAKMETWRGRVAAFRNEQRRVVVWGAGSKGVTFLNMLAIDHTLVPVVVDLNPRKHGLHVACTGQQVVGPDFLRTYRPHVVLIMNPAYEAEIRKMLDEMGVDAEILTV